MFQQAPVTMLLLAANVLVSLYALSNPALIDRLSFRPQHVLRQGEWWRLLTGGFVHAGIAHLAFNAITLYFFGRFIEVLLGPGPLLIIYFGSELAAHGLTLAAHHDDPHYAAVGASGAVSGVVFGFCLFRPLRNLYLFFAIPIPALLFAVGYVGFSIYAMRETAEGRAGMTGGIAHEAHLGGAIGGLLLTVLLEPRAIGIFLRQLGSVL
jgi:membrane associated rhomboid family serine protease